MTDPDILSAVRTALQAVLPDADARPQSKAGLAELEAGAGIGPSRDLTPAERTARRNRRRAQARRRNERIAARKEVVASGPQQHLLEPRLRPASEIAWTLQPKVVLVAQVKTRKTARLLGIDAVDVAADALLAVAESIARSEFDLDTLDLAAQHILAQPGLPDVTNEDAFGAPWLMAVLNRRTVDAVRLWLRRLHHERPLFDTNDAMDATLASLYGTGDDYYARFKADRQPGLLGGAFVKPGELDRHLLGMLASEAITDLGLDALVEVLMVDEHRRTDGFAKWRLIGHHVFDALEHAQLERLGFDARARTIVAGHAHFPDEELRGRYARGFTRRALRWLPPFLLDCVRRMQAAQADPQVSPGAGYSDKPLLTYVQAPVPDARTLTRLLLDVLA